MTKFEILMGKINKQDVGDYFTTFECGTIEEGKEKFKDFVSYEESNLKAWALNKYQHVEIILQVSKYDEEGKWLESEILESIELYPF